MELKCHTKFKLFLLHFSFLYPLFLLIPFLEVDILQFQNRLGKAPTVHQGHTGWEACILAQEFIQVTWLFPVRRNLFKRRTTRYWRKNKKVKNKNIRENEIQDRLP